MQWALLLIVCLGCAGAGVAADEAWVHRAHGTPAVHFLWMNFAPKDGPIAQRDAALAEVQTLKGDVDTLNGAISRQNAAIQAQASAGAAALAKSQNAVTDYRSALADASSKIRILSAPIKGDTVCQRVENFDATYLRELGQ